MIIDEGDAKNEAREREIEAKIMELKAQGLDAVTLDKWAKALQTLKKKNLMARKKRSDQAEKTQVPYHIYTTIPFIDIYPLVFFDLMIGIGNI